MLWGKGEIELLYYSALKEYEGVNLWSRNSDSDEHTFFINHAVSGRSEGNFCQDFSLYLRQNTELRLFASKDRITQLVHCNSLGMLWPLGVLSGRSGA